MEFKLDRNELIYTQLADLLRNEIIHGDFTKAPSIRTLAQRFSVNFKTANKAINQLINEGYLYRVRGKGTFVVKHTEPLKETVRIGFILPNILNPYFSFLAHITETLAYDENTTVIVFSSGSNGTKIDSIMQEYQKQEVDIILLHGGVLKAGAQYQQIARYNIPIVGMHTELSSIDNVWPDVKEAAFIVTDYLISKYGPEIGYVSGSRDPIQQTGRYHGYAEALLKNGSSVNSNLVEKADPTYRGGYLAIRNYLEKDYLPRAIVFYNEIMAMGAATALTESGLTIPDTTAIAGIDDSIPTEHMVYPIPTVSLSNHELAKKALMLCKRRLEIPNALPLSLRIEPKLITR